jgi:hypothetical protein
MGTRSQKGLPAELEQVRGQLERWRGQKRNGQRIPEPLWSAAVRAVRHHGVNRVSRALGLDYYHLKRRAGLCKQNAEVTEGTEGLFVELEGPRAERGVSCVVELEKGNGAKLRVCVGDAATVDWCRVKEAFLGA